MRCFSHHPESDFQPHEMTDARRRMWRSRAATARALNGSNCARSNDSLSGHEDSDPHRFQCCLQQRALRDLGWSASGWTLLVLVREARSAPPDPESSDLAIDSVASHGTSCCLRSHHDGAFPREGFIQTLRRGSTSAAKCFLLNPAP